MKGTRCSKTALDLTEHPHRLSLDRPDRNHSDRGPGGRRRRRDPGRALAPVHREHSGTCPLCRPIALTIVVVLITFFSILLGELVPKRLGPAKPGADGTHRGWADDGRRSRIFKPFVWLMYKPDRPGPAAPGGQAFQRAARHRGGNPGLARPGDAGRCVRGDRAGHGRRCLPHARAAGFFDHDPALGGGLAGRERYSRGNPARHRREPVLHIPRLRG